jgi:hypothetical protein
MTAPLLRRHTDAVDASQRFAADEAGRERSTVDVVSLYHAVRVKLAEGRTDEAKAMVKAWKEGK